MTQQSQRDVVGNPPILGDPATDTLAAGNLETFSHRGIVQFEALARALGRTKLGWVVSASVAVMVLVVGGGFAANHLLGTSDRTSNAPESSPSETGLTFFGSHGMVSVGGVRLKTTSNHPTSPPGTPSTELDSRYLLDPMIDVPAGASFNVGSHVAGGWVDVYDLSEPAQRLYELDLAASPSMPEESGTYYLEFRTGGCTLLVPIRVVAPEDS